MAKLLILSVIAVSVSAQFSGAGHGELRTLRVNPEGELAATHHHLLRTDHVQVGGFQNGHFAETDGRLRTNLDSKPENDYQPQDESHYVEEGAAFRRPAHQDVHSSLGRVVDVSYVTLEKNSNEKRFIDNESQDYERREHTPTVQIQTEVILTRNSNENIAPYQDKRQNKFNSQTQRAKNQESRNHSEGHADISHEGHGTHSTQEVHNRNNFNNQYTQQITQTNTNSSGTREPVSNNFMNKGSTSNQSYDSEAIREMNNQISKMIFSESTLEVTTKSNTKTTKDNELPRSSGKEGDRWIWNDGTKNETDGSTTVVPTVDDRAAFAGDQCPTGKVKINNMCVEGD